MLPSGYTRKTPEGYTRKTPCCMRCKNVADHSHPDCIELYCNIDKTEPERPPNLYVGSEEHDRFTEIEMMWEVPRLVDAWSTCPKWEQRDGECEHGRIGYCSDCRRAEDAAGSPE